MDIDLACLVGLAAYLMLQSLVTEDYFLFLSLVGTGNAGLLPSCALLFLEVAKIIWMSPPHDCDLKPSLPAFTRSFQGRMEKSLSFAAPAFVSSHDLGMYMFQMFISSMLLQFLRAHPSSLL